ncbi:phage minor capsid protein [Brevibacterium oceani]|uniref:phage minor capsid protein n=1 Tax=Brevibacterium oceani TaxID=358099 RepID=UPI0015E6497F|nr:phage minor capsid protein [Brevibacterium oceani]
MAVSPDYARELVQAIREVYEDATTRLIAAIAEQVAEGIQDEGRADFRLESFLRLIQRIDVIIDDLRRGVPGAVERAIGIAYRRGSAVATADAGKAGLPAANVGAVAAVGRTDAITRLLSEAMRPHEEAILQIRRQARDAYDRAVTNAVAQMLTGSGTRFEAARDAVLDLMRSGVTTFRDRTGRKWDLASYVEMATRTSAGNAMIEGHTDRLVDMGEDLVIVSNAPEECKICRPFEGRVLSVSGRTTGKLSDGKTVMCSVSEAKREGLFHPNCRHSMSLYLVGVTEAPTRTADPEGDKLRQRQRAYERRIREWKRRVAMDEATLGKDHATTKADRKKLRTAQSEFRAWREANGRKNLSRRTNITVR